ncbi:hypothetical protein PR202_gb19305 [Eleusine coracana subsp. coracana]|uniref:FAF domain-containing protein n=1 Tax=Eleusine coracana subsp. coracana TaxID=191504 RepID=A0AAV5F7Y9_ELECO|nr:hypothetical protein QOZ80_3BG0286230 [Eleusine coracana subsp. coracana]GJN30957.1 hypothetical protein PR202_gb19305 [Eleusine coracana subsp. coracana]
MALTVFETAVEQVRPCNAAVEQVKVAATAPAAGEKAAVKLKETDRGGEDDRPERADIWNMIQAQKPAAPKQQPAAAAAYVHPLVRRSSSLLTQKSLEICTESLGSETGSDGFSDAATDRGSSDDDDERAGDEVQVAAPAPPPSKAFPPPLPSLARRRTVMMGAMEMRQHRSEGRLVVQAVPVPSATLFRAQRSGGRLLLSFADERAHDEEDQDQVVEPDEQPADERAQEEEDDEEEEEEVEVVDRGTVVEFKVSTQPQARNGSGNRVHRSALVINKFVGAEPADTCGEINDAAPRPPRRPTGSTTTAIAALAAASALSAAAGNGGEEEEEDVVPGATLGENKLLMTARRRRSKEELLKHMRRCGELSGKRLFFWEEPRIATSS